MGKHPFPKVTAIVPCYNEAPRIERVLEALTTYPFFTEIIVVDDGSTDDTKEVLKKFPIQILKNEANHGKGYSIDRAVQIAQGDILFLCDADIHGLNHRIIKDVLEPVINRRVEMFIAMRNRKIYFTNKVLKFVPLLGGERALTKQLWSVLPNYFKNNFRLEAGLNFYAEHHGKGLDYKVYPQLGQTIKEKKYGLIKGIRRRISMYIEIIEAQLFLLPEYCKIFIHRISHKRQVARQLLTKY